jgi:hypothetical protein
MTLSVKTPENTLACSGKPFDRGIIRSFSGVFFT